MEARQDRRVREVFAQICAKGAEKEGWMPGDIGIACLTMFFGMSMNLGVEPRLVKQMIDRFYEEYAKEFRGSTEGTS